MDRYQSIMEGAATWGSYYRHNPDKFAEEYLHIGLKPFQKILLIMMFWSMTFVLIACRGLGKTFISAVYCVVRCILFPGQTRLSYTETYKINPLNCWNTLRAA